MSKGVCKETCGINGTAIMLRNFIAVANKLKSNCISSKSALIAHFRYHSSDFSLNAAAILINGSITGVMFADRVSEATVERKKGNRIAKVF